MKYYKKGENIIASDLDLDLPEATEQEWEQYNLPTKEEQSRKREQAYKDEVDGITAHISRLRDLEQTEEIQAEIAELIAERDAKVEEIKQRYPYPTDPII